MNEEWNHESKHDPRTMVRLKNQLRKTWSALTDADLEAISKDREQLVHAAQKRYPHDRSLATSLPRFTLRCSWQAAISSSLPATSVCVLD